MQCVLMQLKNLATETNLVGEFWAFNRQIKEVLVSLHLPSEYSRVETLELSRQTETSCPAHGSLDMLFILFECLFSHLHYWE